MEADQFMLHTREQTIASLVSDLFAARTCDHAVVLQLGGVVIEVRSDSALLVELLAEYFRPFLTENSGPDIVVSALEGPDLVPPVDLVDKEPDPGKTRIKEEFADLRDGRIVRKRLTGMAFLMAEGLNVAVGHCVANVNQVVNFVNSRYTELLLRQKGLLCHASAVAQGGRAVVMAGRPGAGKSTLALRLVDEGLDFVSNDRLVMLDVHRKTRVHGVPKLPRVNPGTIISQPRLRFLMDENDIAEVEALSLSDLWQTERKFDVPLDRIYGPNRFRLDSDLAAVVILDWTLGGGPCRIELFEPSEQPDVLLPLVKSPGLFLLPDPATGEGGLCLDPRDYARLMVGVPAFHITGGVDFEAATELCRNLID
jgi:HprK-related kinase B